MVTERKLTQGSVRWVSIRRWPSKYGSAIVLAPETQLARHAYEPRREQRQLTLRRGGAVAGAEGWIRWGKTWRFGFTLLPPPAAISRAGSDVLSFLACAQVSPVQPQRGVAVRGHAAQVFAQEPVEEKADLSLLSRA